MNSEYQTPHPDPHVYVLKRERVDTSTFVLDNYCPRVIGKTFSGAPAYCLIVLWMDL